MRQKLLLLALVLTLALAGCGSGDGDQSQGSEQSTTAMSGPPGGTAATEGKEAQKAQKGSKAKGSETEPKGSSEEATPNPQTKALRRNFPKPKPAPGARQSSTGAIQAGEEACRGLTPTEVKESFYAKAKANLDPDQIELIEELPRYEEEAPQDPSFVAGQIAATIYSATLPAEEGQYGFQGCVYVLARGVASG